MLGLGRIPAKYGVGTSASAANSGVCLNSVAKLKLKGSNPGKLRTMPPSISTLQRSLSDFSIPHLMKSSIVVTLGFRPGMIESQTEEFADTFDVPLDALDALLTLPLPIVHEESDISRNFSFR